MLQMQMLFNILNNKGTLLKIDDKQNWILGLKLTWLFDYKGCTAAFVKLSPSHNLTNIV